MEIFDNVNRIVKTDLEASIQKGSRLSIAAACFSIYAYQALKKQLDGIELEQLAYLAELGIVEGTSLSEVYRLPIGSQSVATTDRKEAIKNFIQEHGEEKQRIWLRFSR